MTPPLTDFNVKALASVTEASGTGIYQHLRTILPPLFDGMFTDSLEPVDSVVAATKRVVLSFVDDDGVVALMGELLKLIGTSQPTKLRLAATTLVGVFASETTAQYESELSFISSVSFFIP